MADAAKAQESELRHRNEAPKDLPDVKQFEAKLLELDPIVDKVVEAEKRVVYAQLELLRIDFSEVPAVSAYLEQVAHEENAEKKKALQESPAGKLVEPLLGRFDALRAKLNIKTEKRQLSKSLFRSVACFIFVFFVAVPVMIAACPLWIFHPYMRRLGFMSNSLPLNVLFKVVARSVCAVLGVTIQVEGFQNVVLIEPVVGTFSHGSNFDPIVVEAASPICFKYVGKKILFQIPIIGWLLWAYGHIPIKRENRAQAIDSLRLAGLHIKNKKASIAISPEGTRSKTGQLLDFKKGPFHLAKETGLKLQPIVLKNAFELWPPGQHLPHEGTITVQFLPAVERGAQESITSFSNRLRRAMLKASAEPINKDAMFVLRENLLHKYMPAAMYVWFFIVAIVFNVLF